ncbi:hypothetical protein [Actinoplanes sp. NPDC049599]|uniref:hypothetical protein n=1 Tax=Actinoplanes sp. NPDC049599 TaxID=3363903 RepID=UPI0037917A1B
MISFSRTATATFLVLGSLTGCSGAEVTPGNSVPVTPSDSASTVAPAPSGPYNSVPTGPAPSKPAGIPKTPTDNIPSPGWIEGTITRGGGGPCYGLVTFDGVAYAMYSVEGIKLAKGDHIRAELTPAKLRIDCGEGIPVAMGAIQRFP